MPNYCDALILYCRKNVFENTENMTKFKVEYGHDLGTLKKLEDLC